MTAPSTSWATWAWEAYKDGRLVEVSSDTATWNAAIRAAAEAMVAIGADRPLTEETLLALLKEEKE